jgi:hypothetical protein
MTIIEKANPVRISQIVEKGVFSRQFFILLANLNTKLIDGPCK